MNEGVCVCVCVCVCVLVGPHTDTTLCVNHSGLVTGRISVKRCGGSGRGRQIWCGRILLKYILLSVSSAVFLHMEDSRTRALSSSTCPPPLVVPPFPQKRWRTTNAFVHCVLQGQVVFLKLSQKVLQPEALFFSVRAVAKMTSPTC